MDLNLNRMGFRREDKEEMKARIKLLHEARRYFVRSLRIESRSPTNLLIAERVLERFPGASLPDRASHRTAGKFLIKMYQGSAAAGYVAGFEERQQRLPSRPIPEGVDPASKEFLQTYEWRELRYRAIRHYGAKCMCCGATTEQGAVMNVDHIRPRKLRPDLALDIGNLQILCGDCNAGKGNWDQTDWRT